MSPSISRIAGLGSSGLLLRWPGGGRDGLGQSTGELAGVGARAQRALRRDRRRGRARVERGADAALDDARPPLGRAAPAGADLRSGRRQLRRRRLEGRRSHEPALVREPRRAPGGALAGEGRQVRGTRARRDAGGALAPLAADDRPLARLRRLPGKDRAADSARRLRAGSRLAPTPYATPGEPARARRWRADWPPERRPFRAAVERVQPDLT